MVSCHLAQHTSKAPWYEQLDVSSKSLQILQPHWTLKRWNLLSPSTLDTAVDKPSQGKSSEGPAEEEDPKADPPGSDLVVHLSRREAKQALLEMGSNLERAARQARRDRQAKVDHRDGNVPRWCSEVR